MRKIISKIAGTLLGLSLVMGGAIFSKSNRASETKASVVTDELTVAVAHGQNTSASGEDSFTYGSLTVHTTSGGLNCTEYRFGKSSTTTISCSSGNISSIVFTCTASGTTKYGPGCFASQTGYSYSDKTGTWTGSAASVSFVASSNQVRATKIAITYDNGSSSETTYHVIDNVSNGTLNKDSVLEGTTLSVVISPDSGYYIPESVSVLMGTESSAFTYTNGTVTVENVIGDITISGSCVAIPSPVHAGTQADPYTVADAIHAIDLNSGLSNVYAKGIVSQIVTAYSTQYLNITFDISDDGSTESTQLRAFRCKGSSSFTIDDANDVKVGAIVVVYGTLVNYSGTREFSADCQVISHQLVTALTSISLSGNYQTTFALNDTFNHDGLVVTAHYEDESSDEVSGYTVSSPDMSTTGEKTITVTYIENEVTKTATYTINVVSEIIQHTISFVANGGAGSMASVLVNEGENYNLPECTFTAPEGKKFAGWTLNGTDIVTLLENVTSDVSVTALWIDKPAEATTDYDFSSSIPEEWAASMDKTTTDTSLGRGIGWGAAKGEITLTLSNSDEVSSVVITASTNNAGNTLSVTVGETAYGTAQEIANGTDNKNKEYTFSGSSSGDIVITINDSAKTVWVLKVSVTTVGGTPQPEKVLTGITVSGAKTDFTVGESFATTGLIVTAHYEDAADAVISSGFTVDSSLVNSSAAGKYTVTVSYQTKSDSYDVTYSEAVPPTVATYKKVETNLADFSGSYLVVYEGGENDNWAFDGSLSTLDASSNRVEVSITDDKIELSEAYEFHIAAKEDGYSIQSKSGMYIGKTADSNGLDSKATDNYNNGITFTLGETSDMTVTSEGGAVLRYNPSSGQDRFRFFKSSTYTSQKAISLYIKVEDKAQELALDILNLTSPICSAEEKDFTSVWSTLSGKWGNLSPEEKAYLVGLDADAHGTFVAEALARYDIICSAHKLTPFMEGRVVSGAREYSAQLANNSSTIIIVVVALTSITSIGVLLVIKRKRSLVK